MLINRMCFVPNLAVRHNATFSAMAAAKASAEQIESTGCAVFNWKLAKSNKISTQSQLHSNILSLCTGFASACTVYRSVPHDTMNWSRSKANTFLADGCIDAIFLQHFLCCLWCQQPPTANTFYKRKVVSLFAFTRSNKFAIPIASVALSLPPPLSLLHASPIRHSAIGSHSVQHMKW